MSCGSQSFTVLCALALKDDRSNVDKFAFAQLFLYAISPLFTRKISPKLSNQEG